MYQDKISRRGFQAVWLGQNYKNINPEVMTQISQQRKQRKHIVCTSQVFGRMAKPLREQFSAVVKCQKYFVCFLFFITLHNATPQFLSITPKFFSRILCKFLLYATLKPKQVSNFNSPSNRAAQWRLPVSCLKKFLLLNLVKAGVLWQQSPV